MIRLPSALPITLFLLALAFGSTAQLDPDGAKPPVQSGHHILLHTALHMPWGELAERFGTANTVGIGWRRTATSGWRYGVQYRFQTGADVREPGLLSNLIDPNGHIVDNEGRIALLTPQQRGTLLLATLGRQWPLDARRPETGLLVELGAGFWEHKVHFQNRGNRITQLDEPHLRGYDRLSGGWVLVPRAGFEYHSPNGQARFQVGLEALLGRIRPSRSWNADTGMADEGIRRDHALGLFASWILRLKARSTSVDYTY